MCKQLNIIHIGIPTHWLHTNTNTHHILRHGRTHTFVHIKAGPNALIPSPIHKHTLFLPKTHSPASVRSAWLQRSLGVWLRCSSGVWNLITVLHSFPQRREGDHCYCRLTCPVWLPFSLSGSLCLHHYSVQWCYKLAQWLDRLSCSWKVTCLIPATANMCVAAKVGLSKTKGNMRLGHIPVNNVFPPQPQFEGENIKC